MDKDQTEKLFSGFPPVSTKEWEEVLRKDLGEADYEKKLMWKTREGFIVKPYYRAEDLDKLGHSDVLPSEFPFIRGNGKTTNEWFIRQDIYIEDYKKANKKALDVLMKGVTSLGFIIDPKLNPAEKEIGQLCEGIHAEAVELNFICDHDSLKVFQPFYKWIKQQNSDPEKIFGSIDFDPLGQFVLNGKFPNSEETSFRIAGEMIEAAGQLPLFRVLTVNAGHYHNSGATLVESLGFALAHGTEYLTRLTDRGVTINKVAPKIKFNFAVGPNYFMEIAKFRAARLLWAHIVKAFGPDDDSVSKIHIHAGLSRWNKTMYDPYVNMLRTTTEGMSAITAGIGSLTILPFDGVYEDPSDFSERIARNQQLLLKEESYLDKVIDPAAGSYYIETLTDSIADEAWKLFLEIQEKGGFSEAFKSGYIQSKIKASARQRDMDIAMCKEVILGTNQYPNTGEIKTAEVSEKVFNPLDQKDQEADIETLKPYRGAQSFEKLRYRTDRFALTNPRPKVFLITMGNLAIRRARAQFAGNFFGCAGFEIIDNNGFDNVEEAASACLKTHAELSVICSSDDEYGEIAPKLNGLLKDKAIVVIAGFPRDLVDKLKEEGIQHFIHVKSNVLETLKEFQQLVGVA